MKYPKDVDEEIVSLLDVINSVPRLRTMFSCCGHGREPFYLVAASEDMSIFMKFLEILKFKCLEETVEAIFRLSSSKMALRSEKIMLEDKKFFGWIDSRCGFACGPCGQLNEREFIVASVYSDLVRLSKSRKMKSEIRRLENAFKALVLERKRKREKEWTTQAKHMR